MNLLKNTIACDPKRLEQVLMERKRAMSRKCENDRVRFSVPAPLLLCNDTQTVLRHVLDIESAELGSYMRSQRIQGGTTCRLNVVCRLDQFARLAVASMQFSADAAEGFMKFKPEIVPHRDPTNLDVSDR